MIPSDTIDRDLFVMGGAEPSVGVVGWGIGGGFGAQSKKFGTGAANMLEARVVTAAGQVVVASEFQADDFFGWKDRQLSLPHFRYNGNRIL